MLRKGSGNTDVILVSGYLGDSAFIKLLALSLSLGFGFVGGNVFPYLFTGVCIGSATNVLIPQVCMAAMASSIFPLLFTNAVVISTAMAMGGFATSPVFIGSVVAFSVGPGLGLPQRLLQRK